ncbi:MAG: hypothetical protein M1829_006001 [Trizodia sp. TS-e1964]|nr:MAG: hypothetical protein M1829_006001 [Trizodia sp. TS-e1964]
MPAIDPIPPIPSAVNPTAAALAPTSTISVIAQVIVDQQGVTQGVTTVPYVTGTVNPGTPTIVMLTTSTETSVPAAASASASAAAAVSSPASQVLPNIPPTTSAPAAAVSTSVPLPASPASTPTPLDLVILAASSTAPNATPTSIIPPAAASSSLLYANPPPLSHPSSSTPPVSSTVSTPALISSPTPPPLTTTSSPISSTGTQTSSIIPSIISPSLDRISGVHNSTNSASFTSSASTTTSSINHTTSSDSSITSSSSSVSTTTSPSITSSDSASTTAESTLQTYSFTNVASSTAGGIGGIGGGAGAAPTAGSGGDSTTTFTGPPGNSSDLNRSGNPPTPVVVGGVVGGICGVAILCLIALFLYKWRKRRLHGVQVHSPLEQMEQPRSGTMTARSSETPFAVSNAAAMAGGGFLRRFTASSQQTATSDATTSERGFYKVSGRKIPSVLTSGGDGYGADESTNQHVLSGSSFYRDSAGFYGGPASPTSPTNSTGPSRDGGVAALRPSPARTPVTSHAPFTPMSASPTSPHPPARRFGSPDGLGRSHPSHDGSHVSRGSRFREDMT